MGQRCDHALVAGDDLLDNAPGHPRPCARDLLLHGQVFEREREHPEDVGGGHCGEENPGNLHGKPTEVEVRSGTFGTLAFDTERRELESGEARVRDLTEVRVLRVFVDPEALANLPRHELAVVAVSPT